MTTTPDLELEFLSTQEAPENKTPEPDVPEKYKGKSVEEIIEMHRNAEKALSRQGQDLAEQRRLTDEILKLKAENVKPSKEVKPVTPDDLFQDPDKAIKQAVADSDFAEKANKAEQRVNDLERKLSEREFKEAHPSFVDDVQDPAFQKWVQSNRARMNLLADLHYNYNFDAGKDLWDMWNEQRAAVVDEKKEVGNETRKKVMKAGSTVRSSATTADKPTFSRAKLLELQMKAYSGDLAARSKWNDPDFQKAYMSAYAEGRVK